MTPTGLKVLRRLEKMSVFQQTSLMVGAAMIGANALTAIFFGLFFEDRLLLDLILTSIIVVIVGYPLGFFFIGQNVRLREMAAELDRVSRVDDLTNLPNRRSFMREAEDALMHDGGDDGALLFIDVDNFKQLNDRFGHAAGDEILRGLGTVIAGCIRESDIAARLGGEEFVVFMPQAGMEAARGLAELIRMRVTELGDVGGDLSVTVSIGVALRGAAQELDELLRAADANLYEAKQKGRDRIVWGGSRAA